MSKVDRNNPKRSSASESAFSFFEFDQTFPDDGTCLDLLVGQLYPSGIHCPTCNKVTKHHRLNGKPIYSCQFCGHHEHPMVGTIFEGSATSLRLWFHAMYLMSSTRCGISAKQLERQLGVTYKTAWRMFHKIRSLMGDDDTTLEGTVEADEVYMGPKVKGMHAHKRALRAGARGTLGKTPVFGMVQRGSNGKNGRIVARVVGNTSKAELTGHIVKKVLPASLIYTDEWASYNDLRRRGYRHDRVHHTQHIYVSGDVHTNTIEGFWSLLRRGISGAYHSVSDKYLQMYVDEYTFRYNHRDAGGRGMFTALMNRVQKVPSA